MLSFISSKEVALKGLRKSSIRARGVTASRHYSGEKPGDEVRSLDFWEHLLWFFDHSDSGKDAPLEDEYFHLNFRFKSATYETSGFSISNPS